MSPKTAAPDACSRLARNESGQIVITALLAFLPMLLLLVSLINTGLATQERVARQTATDAAALSAAAVEARGLNLMSAVNVTQTYILAEALAEQALLDALDVSEPAALAEYQALQTACAFAVLGGGVACALVPIAYAQWYYLKTIKAVARSVLPPLCTKPTGFLWQALRGLEAINSAISVAPVGTQAAAIATSRENGMEGAVLVPTRLVLPVHKGSFQDFGDPMRYGSRCESDGVPQTFQRGYHPIIGLPWNAGPLASATPRYRGMMSVAYLVFGGDTYDWTVDNVYRQWFGYEAVPRPRGRSYRNYHDARAHAHAISQCTYAWIHVVTLYTDRTIPPTLDELLGSARVARGSARTMGELASLDIQSASNLVDVADARAKTYQEWFDPEASPPEDGLTRIKPGAWQVGRTKVEEITQDGHTLYRYILDGVIFQVALAVPRRPAEIPYGEESVPSADDPLLPHPYLLDECSTPDQIPGFRAKTYILAVAWENPGPLLAPIAFGRDGEKRIGYAQAESYNGTSWDLFTQDWRVRLVPASLLERPDAAGPLEGSAPLGAEALIGIPSEVGRWLNTH